MQPECNFFFKSAEYAKGLEYYSKRWFSDVPDVKAVGERSSLLLSGAWVPQRLVRDLPGVRLIFLLRNPVDRAYANYRFTALAGFEDLPFEEALAREPQRIAAARAQGGPWSELQPHAYFTKGLYYEQLRAYQRHFPKEQMLVVRSDWLLKDQDAALGAVYSFLGVDTGFKALPFSDLSSPAVRDLALQVRIRREHPERLDGAIQRIRCGLPPTNAVDAMVLDNVQTGYPPLEGRLRKELADRYAESNGLLAPDLRFSIEDWF